MVFPSLRSQGLSHRRNRTGVRGESTGFFRWVLITACRKGGKASDYTGGIGYKAGIIKDRLAVCSVLSLPVPGSRVCRDQAGQAGGVLGAFPAIPWEQSVQGSGGSVLAAHALGHLFIVT
ncbi:hypothetical protein FKM82_018328 [Ascaphus truei]